MLLKKSYLLYNLLYNSNLYVKFILLLISKIYIMIPSNSKDDKEKDAGKSSRTESEKTTGSNASSKADAKKMDEKKSGSSSPQDDKKKSDKDSGSHSSKKH